MPVTVKKKPAAATQAETVTETPNAEQGAELTVSNAPEVSGEAPTMAAGLAKIEEAVHDMQEALTEGTEQTTEEAPKDQVEVVAPKAPKTATPNVMVTLPYKGESKAFIEVLIDEKQAWLSKSSISSYLVEGNLVSMELSRTLARRRGLISAA
jgi:hypothetical protein